MDKVQTKDNKLTIRIDPELKRGVQAKADSEDLTLSQVIRFLLQAYLDGKVKIEVVKAKE